MNKPEPFLTTDWLLEIFGSDVRRARGNYVKFVEADMKGKRSKIEYKYQLFPGSDDFAESILKRYGPFNSMKGINNTQLGVGRPSLEKLFNGVEMSKVIRNQAILKAYREHKFPLKDIVAHLKMNPNYLIGIINRLET